MTDAKFDPVIVARRRADNAYAHAAIGPCRLGVSPSPPAACGAVRPVQTVPEWIAEPTLSRVRFWRFPTTFGRNILLDRYRGKR